MESDIKLLQIRIDANRNTRTCFERELTPIAQIQLVSENSQLKKDVEEANRFINGLKATIFELENEKSSLLTSIRIIQEDSNKQKETGERNSNDRDSTADNPRIEVNRKK